MRETKRTLGLMVALSLLLSTVLFDTCMVVHADEPPTTPTPTAIPGDGGGTNGGGGSDHKGG